MEYTGKLYGKIGRETFDTGKTSKDWDNIIENNFILRKSLVSLQMSLMAHPDYVCNDEGEFKDMVSMAEDVLNRIK